MKKQVLSFIKRYKIHLGILLFFLVYMLFFDEFNWLRIQKDNHKLKSLKEERAYLREKIKDDRLQLKTLQTDTQQLEKFAREKYLLKKENEDVFIIQEEE